MENTAEKSRLVYTGRVIMKNQKLGHSYRIVKPDGNLGEKLTFAKKLLECAIGQIIATEVTPTGVQGERSWAGKYGNPDEIGQWKAKDEMNSREIELKKKMAAVPVNSYSRAMEALKDIVAALPRTQRQLFITKVAYELANVR